MKTPTHVLLLHALPDRYYFRDVARGYLEAGVRVTVFCEDCERHNYRKCFEKGASHLLHPDFLEPQAWERDPGAERGLREALRACEAVDGRAFGRVLLSGERDISRAWTAGEYYWNSSPMQRRCLADPELPERIALRHFAFWREQLASGGFDLVLGRSNCDVVGQSLLLLCRQAGVPFLALRNSKMFPERLYWTGDLLMDNALARDLYREKDAAGAAPGEAGKARLLDFLERPAPSRYILENWSKIDALNFFGAHGEVWTLLRDRLRHHRKGFRGKPPKPVLSKLWELYRILWCKLSHRRFFRAFDDAELAGMTYAYLPLHKEPELMLNFRAPLWHTQRHGIKYIGSMLPAGFRLLAREHKGNAGRRHGRWLREVGRYPRTCLVDPFDSQYRYIAHADVVVTDNGTAGWEGIMLGRPVVTLETAFYDPVGLAVPCRDLNKLDRSIFEALAQRIDPEERKRRIRLFLDAEAETTLPREEARADIALTLRHIRRVLEHGGSRER